MSGPKKKDRYIKSQRGHTKLNHVPLTIETLRAAYDYLATTPPFNRWNLPDSEELQFKVANDPNYVGWHSVSGRGKQRKHLIAVSSRCIGYTSNLMTVMAHEILHYHQAVTGQSTNGEHNAAFRKEAEIICRVHGIDYKAF